MSDIFYTEVDKNLQFELIARAAAGKRNRTTRDINFMLGKIANVQVTPYDITYEPDTDNQEQVVDQKTPIFHAILGGKTVRANEFMPSGPRGFLSDRPTFTTIDEDRTKASGNARTNTSKRIPPYITALDVQIGDDSMGVMQTANINLTIPNPVRDLNFFESVYMRPGRHCRIEIEHPDVAMVSMEQTGGRLTNDVMPSSEKLKKLGYEKEDIDEFVKMNKFVFDGVITSFDMNYQEDASVAVGLVFRGTTQIYTDVSMAMDEKEEKDKKTKESTPTNFWSTINDIVEAKRLELDKNKGVYSDPTNDNIHYIWGKIHDNISLGTYITLGALIDFINKFLVIKMKSVIGNAQIICDKTDDLCTSKYYEFLVSCNPGEVFFPGQDTYGEKTLFEVSKLTEQKPKFSKTEKPNSVSYPSLIFISMKTIQNIVNDLSDANTSTYTVKQFLQEISKLIYKASGRAIDMQLISHPERKTMLLYYDSNNVRPPTNVAEPFSVPMFANDPIGTIVKTFNFNGKLPQDASTLAYVMNQDPSNISESDVAPFLSYMYSANTLERGITDDGKSYEVSSNLITDEQLQEVEEKYAKQHKDRLDEYFKSIEEFSKTMDGKNDRATLEKNLKKYIQYPFSTIERSNQLKAPVIPFSVDFSIDGINGFRYGDILVFKGLPARYTNNTVFSVVGVGHSVNDSGEWNTDIKCIMRPKIDNV